MRIGYETEGKKHTLAASGILINALTLKNIGQTDGQTRTPSV